MKRKIFTGLLPAVWLGLTLWSWFAPAKLTSQAERRNLAQLPDFSLNSLLSGRFASDFESYTQDQFPLRDGFRSLKSIAHYVLLGQKDKDGVYLHAGYAAQQVYPMSDSSLNHAMSRFQWIHDQYLADSGCWFAIVPDKGCYLADEAGQPGLSYDALYAAVEEAAPWATHIDLRDTLTLESYYRTDTHWRQETLFPVAEKLLSAMDAPLTPEDFTQTTLDAPFYGVYCGQAAMPMKPDSLTILESEILQNCRVFDYETGKTGEIYDLEKLQSRDPYDVYLSGARALLTIENPLGEAGRELVVFRDSFGSSLVPLLLEGYETVTLVDIRYIAPELLERYLDFHGQDVLFLYSTLVLNSSSGIK